MGFLLLSMALSALALLLDCGPVYPWLWAFGVEPAAFFHALLLTAGWCIVFCPLYELVFWIRRGRARIRRVRELRGRA